MLVATGLLALIIGMAAGVFIWTRGRPAGEETVHLFRCSACGQKLRYTASRAGRPALCPRCGERSTLPQEPVNVEPLSVGRATYVRVGERRMLAG
jgi:DNA-directed RNA polymerase subunit RPC12/RpoP